MCEMSKRIKECRIKTNLTQQELATKLGIQKSAVAKYENGRVKNIKMETLKTMAEIFQCSPAYLMGWDAPDPNDDGTVFAAHKDGENFTPEELEKIEEYKKLLIAARPKG